MSTVWTIARKETRALFLSPVAALFLGVFLFITHFTFFTLSSFFARNLADVRPLFEWMPLLLILLVSAITMRQWAEERKMGTLEVLLTLPVRTVDLVLGKFLAGMALVVSALVLTLPVPLTVAFMGDLDWGPVIGGYLGALLLGGAYMALGLCISAATDNQVVSLMLTLVVGGLLYLLGADAFVGFFSDQGADALRLIGTGSRFESVARGVLDLRDLAYYASLTVAFLVLNVIAVDHLRIDASTGQGRRRSLGRWLTVLLFAGNAIALNVWLTPLHGARVDMTRGGVYSVSPVTRDVLASLDEPLLIQGIFSERTHPELAPLVPQIRDYLTEYQLSGKGQVTVEYLDPAEDEALEEELNEQYGIHSFPFRVTGRHERSVVNSYFHILVRYGDEHELLTWGDLIEVEIHGTEPDVRLRNLEYDLTRAIKRVSQEFQSLESILASLDGQPRLTALISRSTLPADMAEDAEMMTRVATEIAGKSGGRLVYQELDPLADAALRTRAHEEWGVRPLSADLFGREVFYLHLVLQVGDRIQSLRPRGEMTEADLEAALTSAIKRATPGSLTTVGLFTEVPEPPPRNPNMPPQYQPPTPQPDYQLAERMMASEFEVQRLDLAQGYVPDEVDVLLVGKAGELTEAQQYAVDQFLMRGGAVIALAGHYGIGADRRGLHATELHASLADLVRTWGVEVGDSLVMDPQNGSFPMPVRERRGPVTISRVEFVDYPFFPDVRQDGYASGHIALQGLPNLTVPWASELSVDEALEGVSSEVLLQTSEGTWLLDGREIDPDYERHPESGFATGDEVARRAVAVALQGTFPSAFAGRTEPNGDEEFTDPPLERALPDARLVVVGSAELISDLVLSLSRDMGGEVHRNNLQLVENLVDWAMEDTDLLQVRSSGAFARTLDPMEEARRIGYEIEVALVMFIGLLGFLLVPRILRTMATPLVKEES